MDLTPHSPVIVHSRAEIAEILVKARKAQGLTCEGLDAVAGFPDRYATKLENGGTLDASGKPNKNVRQGFHISHMAEVWLEALGFALVLMTREQAVACGAVRAPAKVSD